MKHKKDRVGIRGIRSATGGGWNVATTKGTVLVSDLNILRCALGSDDLAYLLEQGGNADESGCFTILPSEWDDLINAADDVTT